MIKIMLPVISLALLVACDPGVEAENTGTESPDMPPTPVSTPDAVHPDSPDAPTPEPLAVELTRNEWATAANKHVCEPLVLTSDGGAPADARRANFAGGWGVAFDTEKVRSAYGVSGPGLVDLDRADGQEARLKEQWPYFTRLPDLPQPAFAGFGLEGARAYREDAPDGVGDNSLAYIRVAGQDCTYNVWSRLGRAHLEVLLNSLRPSLED